MLKIKLLCYRPYCTCSNKAFKKNILHAIIIKRFQGKSYKKGLKAS
jgi:hypothetical protein